MNNIYRLLPGEDILGFVGRMHYLGPFSAFETTRQHLGLTAKRIQPGKITNKDDLKLGKLLKLEPKYIKKQHSHSMMLQYCATQEEIDKAYDYYATDKVKTVTFFDSSGVKANPWRWCRECASEDSEKFGCSYYHRNHQIQGVWHCHKHECLLMSECQNCAFEANSINKQCVPPSDGVCPVCNFEFGPKISYISPIMLEVEKVLLSMASGALNTNYTDMTKRALDYIGIDYESVELRVGMQYVREFYRNILQFYDVDELTEYFFNVEEMDGNVRLKTMCRNRLYNCQTKQLPLHPICYALMHVFLDHHHDAVPLAA